jgi:serine protease inhibitor
MDLFEQEKNIVVSPLSVLTGLGLLYEGMGDSSRAKVAIGFPNNHETFLKMFKVSQKNH